MCKSRIRNEIYEVMDNIVNDDVNDAVSAEFAFSENFTGFAGHFPGNPVLPGICQIECVVALISKVLKKNIRLHCVKRAKLLNMVLPDETITVTGTLKMENDAVEGKFKITKVSDETGVEVTVSRIHLICNM